MRLVIPSLVVDDIDGFKNDALQRESFGEALSNIITRTSDELVISLDGKWGEGKTTFVKMWQGLLSSKGIPSIYIDAFKHDYTADAFISIASAITSYVDQHATKAEDKANFKDKAKKVGVRLLSWGAKISIKAATLGVVKETDIDALSEIGEDIATDSSDAVAELVKERLSTHAKENDLIQSFRDSLSDIPSSLEGNASGRLVVIIDELDRCKPSFAVEVIEKIKHLFSVKNVVFLLVMHKEQLEEAIKSVYGNNIDAHTYLQKFINIETTIPKRTAERFGNDLDIYSQRLIKLHELQTWGDDQTILECLNPIARHFNLSLRQLEKVFTNIAIIYSTSTENQLRLIPVIIFISTIKVIRPATFEKIRAKRISYSELCNETGLNQIHEESDKDRTLEWSMNWIRYSMLTEAEFNSLPQSDPIKDFRQGLIRYHIGRDRLLPLFCQKLSMFSVN